MAKGKGLERAEPIRIRDIPSRQESTSCRHYRGRCRRGTLEAKGWRSHGDHVLMERLEATPEYDELRRVANWEQDKAVDGLFHVAAFDHSGAHHHVWESAEAFLGRRSSESVGSIPAQTRRPPQLPGPGGEDETVGELLLTSRPVGAVTT